MPNEDDTAVCEHCDGVIRWYVHSRYGALTAGSWTTVGPEEDGDQRYGTTCEDGFRHRVSDDENEGE